MKLPAIAAPAEAPGAEGQDQVAPKARTAGAIGTHVADVKARAKKMRGQGLISQKEHDGLIAKADKVASAAVSGDSL